MLGDRDDFSERSSLGQAESRKLFLRLNAGLMARGGLCVGSAG